MSTHDLFEPKQRGPKNPDPLKRRLYQRRVNVYVAAWEPKLYLTAVTTAEDLGVSFSALVEAALKEWLNKRGYLEP